MRRRFRASPSSSSTAAVVAALAAPRARRRRDHRAGPGRQGTARRRRRREAHLHVLRFRSRRHAAPSRDPPAEEPRARGRSVEVGPDVLRERRLQPLALPDVLPEAAGHGPGRDRRGRVRIRRQDGEGRELPPRSRARPGARRSARRAGGRRPAHVPPQPARARPPARPRAERPAGRSPSSSSA